MSIIGIGLGFGDEGKGTITDYLCALLASPMVVRYNGGPQTAHHVVLPDGKTHCFSQFGSGTLAGAVTYLTQYALVDPLAIEAEAEALQTLGFDRATEGLYIHPKSLVVTPFQKHYNRMLEYSRGALRHGSCGRGVGQTMADAQTDPEAVVRVEDLLNRSILEAKLDFWQEKRIYEAQVLADSYPELALTTFLKQLSQPDYVERLLAVYWRFNRSGVKITSQFPYPVEEALFEPAQGVLLDPEYGWWPNVTKTRTTLANAKLITTEAKPTYIGIIRAYATRHGAGVLVTEEPTLSRAIPELHNGVDQWQGHFRLGWFDAIASSYAVAIAGEKLDWLALTNVDRLEELSEWKACIGYCLPEEKKDLDEFFEWEKVRNGKVFISRLKCPEKPSQERQERCNQILALCRPVYRQFTTQTRLLDFIEKSLGVPLGIVSSGPTNRDKMCLAHLTVS